MSEFDKEAEREKLRKQFERDERKRESTQRMSELLLQGATMTDTHCDSCGDPIFRYDGNEFCPSCQADTDERPADDEQQTNDEQPAEPAERTQIEIEDEPSTRDEHIEHSAFEPTPSPTTTNANERTTGSESSVSPDLTAAHRSLATTITRFAKQAEATEDPDRARKFLAATEDAACALQAVQRTQ